MTRRPEPALTAGRVCKALLELAVVSAAFVLAYLLRFDFDPSAEELGRLPTGIVLAIGAKALALWYFGLFGN